MKYKIAVLDDYQNVALESADWSVLSGRADITVFQDHLDDPDAVIERLLPFDIICVMRERTPLPRNVIERLPNLKLIASTGPVNASIDVAAAADHGIAVVPIPDIDRTRRSTSPGPLSWPVRAISLRRAIRCGPVAGKEPLVPSCAERRSAFLALGGSDQKWPESAALLAWI